MFLKNKYTMWYDRIIENAKGRINEGYVEKHHIIPKSIVKNDDVVCLTAREHYVCHLLLTKMCESKEHKKKMHHALWRMTQLGRAKSSHLYEYARINHSKCVSEAMKGKPKDYAVWNKGIPHSKKTRKNISKGRKGKLMGNQNPNWGGAYWNDERKSDWSEQQSGKGNNFYGRKHSEETKRRMAEKRKLYWEQRK